MDDHSQDRILSGVPGLDQVLGGGLRGGRVHVLKGAPGAGKTVLASQLCFHCASRGARVVYVTLLTELHGTLLDNLRRFSFFDPSVVGHALKYLSLTGGFQEKGLESLIQGLRAAVRQERPTLLVLDGFFPLASTGQATVPVSMFLQDLEALMSVGGTTALLTDSTPARTHSPLHVLVDGIIELEEELLGMDARRTLRVCKLRGARALQGLHTFTIDEAGVRVSPRMPSADTDAPESSAGRGRERQ
jgi:circadian clock protein KaiC